MNCEINIIGWRKRERERERKRERAGKSFEDPE
jgi:hypothetical protein